MHDGTWTDARIFIVDDEPANVRMLERLLGHDGYTQLESFTAPDQVMPRFEMAPPDLVLLDLIMPGVDGYEVLRRIKLQPAPRPPVLVLTADATRSALERALTAGAMDLVTKPFDHLEVLLRVRNLLARRALELDLMRHAQLLEERVRERTRELRENLQQLEVSSRQRHELLVRLARAEEEERARITRNIHDDTVQVMAATGLRLELVARRLTDPIHKAEIQRAHATVAEAIVRLRTLMFELHPPSLDTDGLAASLIDHLGRVHDAGGPQGSVIDRLDREPTHEVAVELYRIAQEAIMNARKHARASTITVELEGDERGFSVVVRDDGQGFELDEAAVRATGHRGLATTKERAILAGGWCRVDSRPGTGTTVTAWIPDLAREDIRGPREDE